MRTIILIICIFFCLVVAGCISPPPKTTKSVQEVQTYVETQSTTTTTLEQIDRWVSAYPNKNLYNPGDAASIDGEIFGSSGPVSISFFRYNDALAKDFSKPVKTASVMPASDHKFHYSYTINTLELPVEYYVIIIKLPTGEWTKLPILIEAKGVNCDEICSQPGPSLRYNERGEAICPC